MTKVLYRFEDVLRSSFDEYSEALTPMVHVKLHKFTVLRETPKWVWIDDYGQDRFVLSGARKKFACPTVQEAKQSFLARKRRQVRILKSQLWRAERAIEIADDHYPEDLCQSTATLGGLE